MPIRRKAASLAAIFIVGVLYLLSRPPELNERDSRLLTQRFSFQRYDLPKISTRTPQQIRQVHPSLRHLANWISFVGAAVSLGDLDGNSLSDDLVYVDPRYDEVTVCPVPGTGNRFEPFVLQQHVLPVEQHCTAPMGARLGDYNEDGRQDILVYFWGRSPIIYLREGLSSQQPTLASLRPVELVDPPEVWHTSCVTQADLDADGHLDLVIGNYNPDGARTLDATDKHSELEVMMGSWGRATNGGKSRLMLWSGGRSAGRAGGSLFVEMEGVLTKEVACGWTFAVGTADFDGDLKPEIYLVNDFGADRLLYNESQPGRLKFRLLHGERTLLTPRSMAVGMDSFNGMGIDFADLNNDGQLDFMVSNITSDHGLHQSNLVLMHSGATGLMRHGIAPFENQSEDYGLSRGGWTWDTKFGDFDSDGTLEVMQATGFMKGKINRWPELHELALANEELASYPIIYPILREGDAVAEREHNPFFVKKDGRYYDIAGYLGPAYNAPQLSRGIATADVDGDGRLDFALANNWEDSYFFRNASANPGAFLGLHLRIPLDPPDAGDTAAAKGIRVDKGHPNPDVRSMPAIGAQATIRFRSGRQKRTMLAHVDGGSGHSGQCAPELHFGLGETSDGATVALSVRWRDREGKIQEGSADGLKPGWHTVYLRGQDGRIR